MKKVIILGFLMFFISSVGYGQSINQSIQRMYDNGLSNYNNSKDFKSDQGLRRDEASKFFVNFAKLQGRYNTNSNNNECEFSDLDQGHGDLQNIIKESCNINLFKGHGGKFMPTNPLTYGQAVTVLIRLIDGYKDESQGHFSDKYINQAIELGLIGQGDSGVQNRDKIITRGEISILLYKAANLLSPDTQPIFYQGFLGNYNNNGETSTNSNYTYYTSSHYSAYLYYCSNDSAWENLSKRYLEHYQTQEALLKKYPTKTLNKPC